MKKFNIEFTIDDSIEVVAKTKESAEKIAKDLLKEEYYDFSPNNIKIQNIYEIKDNDKEILPNYEACDDSWQKYHFLIYFDDVYYNKLVCVKNESDGRYKYIAENGILKYTWYEDYCGDGNWAWNRCGPLLAAFNTEKECQEFMDKWKK